MQVTVHTTNCLPASTIPAAHQRSAICPVPPALDVAAVFAADRFPELLMLIGQSHQWIHTLR